MKVFARPAAVAGMLGAALLLAPAEGRAETEAGGKAAGPVSPAASAAPTQESVAKEFIHHLLTGDRDSVAALFEESVRPHVTPNVVEGLRSQFKWLYDFVGGDFEEFDSGRLDTATYYREYRMSNEINKRSPLVLIKALFPDSITPVLVDAQVKSFVAGDEKQIAGEQVWSLEGRAYDLHSIITVRTPEGYLLAVRFYDPDTADLSRESIARLGIPLARELLARDYMDSARAALPGVSLLPDVGVVFIRNDKREGYEQVQMSFRPADLGLPDSASARAPDTARAKVPAKKPPAKSSRPARR